MLLPTLPPCAQQFVKVGGGTCPPCPMGPAPMVVTQLSLGPNISKRAVDTGLVTVEDESEMEYGESNGHMTDDVT